VVNTLVVIGGSGACLQAVRGRVSRRLASQVVGWCQQVNEMNQPLSLPLLTFHTSLHLFIFALPYSPHGRGLSHVLLVNTAISNLKAERPAAHHLSQAHSHSNTRQLYSSNRAPHQPYLPLFPVFATGSQT
jgi:hypothetical protein